VHLLNTLLDLQVSLLSLLSHKLSSSFLVLVKTDVLLQKNFLEESFAVLISFIFIKESVSKILEVNELYAYSRDPFMYVDGFLTNKCFTCSLKQQPSNASNSSVSVNRTLSLNQTQVACVQSSYRLKGSPKAYLKN
jgi:hypothetical protein